MAQIALSQSVQKVTKHLLGSSSEYLCALWLSLLSWPAFLTLNLVEFSFMSDIVLLGMRISQFIWGRFYTVVLRRLDHLTKVKKWLGVLNEN